MSNTETKKVVLSTDGPYEVQNYSTAVAKLALCSLFGIWFFFIPMFGGSTPLMVTLDSIEAMLGRGKDVLVVVCNIFMMFMIPFGKKILFLKPYVEHDGIASKVLYVLGSIFGVLVFMEIGPDWFLSGDTGALALSLAGDCLLTILIAGIFVTFIANFGILHMVGTFLEPLCRPVYKLPGYAAVDAATSIACSAAVDVFLANKIYLNGLYTKRDVAIVASNFTICSLGFFVLLCDIVGYPEMYGPVMLCSFGICFIMPLFTSRIPPLSKIPNEYVDGTPFDPSTEKKSEVPLFQRSWEHGIAAADEATLSMIVEGAIQSVIFSVKVCTYVMSIATIATVLGCYTPLFTWLGIPFAPILNLLGVPEASAIAPCCLIGISEIAMPALLIADQAVPQAAAFFVVVLSTVQVIFFTESANAIMESDIPLNLVDLIIIFLERTIIAMPMIAVVMHMLY